MHATAAPGATAIAAGANHSCMIRGGKAFCWGDNTNGELGNNSTISSSVPVPVSASGVLAGVTLTQITAGANFTCALASTGAAYCWGLNSNGQLGNNSTTQRTTPVAVSTSGVLGGVTLTQITAGANFTCALSSTGTAYCWGADTNGQLGNNSTTQSQVPVAVNTAGVLAGVALAQISAGSAHTCAVSGTGTAYCWGLNGNGQLGNNSTTQSLVPVAVNTAGALAGKTVTQVSAGVNFTCALVSTGTAYCWGLNSNGQLGNNSTTQSLVPVAVTTSGALAGVTLAQISAGSVHTCAVSSTGTAYCWGLNSNGQLGNNSTTQSLVPVAVTTSGVLAGVTLAQISAGTNFTCALDAAGAAYCWGLNSSGQVGNTDTAVSFLVPVVVSFRTATMAAGSTHSCMIRSGIALCWGDNTSGELGNNSATSSTAPVAANTGGALAGLTLTQITAGTNFTCALASTGTAYCWGDNDNGELGNNSTTQSRVPVAVNTAGALAGKTLVQISAGGDAACAVDTGGAAYCWGANTNGQLGNNSTTQSLVPVAVNTSGVLSGKSVTQVSAGTNFTCALASTGTAYCWGLNASGQLGNNSTTQSLVPVAVTTSGVLAGVTLTQVSVGNAHTCGAAGNGAAYCWGANTNGQLGNNSTTQSLIPVAVNSSGVLSGRSVTQISAGTNFTCAVDSTGAAYCWGLDSNGQLGNNSTTQRTTPVTVNTSGVLSGKTLAQVSTGSGSTCAVDSVGTAYCWGLNSSGQLGNSATAVTFLVPVTVSFRTTAIAAGAAHSCMIRNGRAFCWGDNTNGELGTPEPPRARYRWQ